MNQSNNMRTATLSIRLTDAEKMAIAHKAEKQRKSITQYVIESAITAEPRAMKEIRHLLTTVRKLTDEVKQTKEWACSHGLKSEELYDIADRQNEIYMLLQKYAANGGN